MVYCHLLRYVSSLVERFGTQTKQKIVEGIELCSNLQNEVNENILRMESTLKLPNPIISEVLSEDRQNMNQDMISSTEGEKSTLVKV